MGIDVEEDDKGDGVAKTMQKYLFLKLLCYYI